MNFGGSKYDNPLYFLHELAQVRHRIVHASSILENNKKIFIDMNIFNEFFGFFFHLTDYVDSLFAKKFGYDRKKMNSGESITRHWSQPLYHLRFNYFWTHCLSFIILYYIFFAKRGCSPRR